MIVFLVSVSFFDPVSFESGVVAWGEFPDFVDGKEFALGEVAGWGGSGVASAAIHEWDSGAARYLRVWVIDSSLAVGDPIELRS